VAFGNGAASRIWKGITRQAVQSPGVRVDGGYRIGFCTILFPFRFFHVRGCLVDTIGRYTVEDFIAKLTEFHGNFAPGLLIGGYMVDLAVKNMAHCEFYDAIC